MLPNKVILETEQIDEYTHEMLGDYLNEYLSNKYGYLVKSYGYSVKIEIDGIDWDKEEN